MPKKLKTEFDEEFFQWLYAKITDPREKCSKCGDPCDPSCKFCPWCGFQNEKFSEDEYLKKVGSAFDEATEDCRMGHPDMISCRSQDRNSNLGSKEMRYCDHCGEDVFAGFN